jgi:hypothetical protein
MKKLFLAVLLTGCAWHGQSPSTPSPERPPQETPAPPAGPGDILIINKIVTSQDKERKEVEQAIKDANQVLHSDCFHQALVAANLTSTQGRENEAIYQSLIATPLGLEVHFFTGSILENYFYRTVGRVNSDHPEQIYMNRHFVKSASQIADNLLHEAAHVRGYRHRTAREQTSVPYTMNALFKKCAQDTKLETYSAAELQTIPYHPEE